MALFDRFIPKDKLLSGVLGAFSVDEIKWEPAADADVIVHKLEDEDLPDGSDLIVGPDQMAIFTNGTDVSAIAGPCKIRLDAGDSRFAPFQTSSHKIIGRGAIFHSTVYFVDTTCLTDLKWATPTPIMVRLPVENIDVHITTFGFFGAHVEHGDTSRAVAQAGKFLQKVVGSRTDLTRDELVSFMRAKIQEKVPKLLGDAIFRKNLKVVQLAMYSSYFTEMIHRSLQGDFDEFGLTLDKFTLLSINIAKEDLRMIREAEEQRVLDEIQRKKVKAEGVGAVSQTPAAVSGSFCPSCGTTLPAGARFCGECGTKI